jgi:OmpA-OmpF porin, OOP family
MGFLLGEVIMKRQIGHFILVALVSVLSLGSAPALSQDVGFYAGFNVGKSEAKDACTGFPPGVSCDDSDTALSIFGGYQFNKNFGAEFGYTDLGKVKISGGGNSASIEASGFEISAVGTFPINPQFSLYGKLGMFLWDADFKSNLGNVSDDGADLTYGIGVRWNFAKNLALQAQWQRYNDVGDTNTTGKADVDVIGVGLLFRF